MTPASPPQESKNQKRGYDVKDFTAVRRHGDSSQGQSKAELCQSVTSTLPFPILESGVQTNEKNSYEALHTVHALLPNPSVYASQFKGNRTQFELIRQQLLSCSPSVFHSEANLTISGSCQKYKHVNGLSQIMLCIQCSEGMPKPIGQCQSLTNPD